MILHTDWLLPLVAIPLFFIIAGLYASVGHGGASGYLALFALLGVAASHIVPTVLILNILVASVSFWQFQRQGHFKVTVLLPFIVTSIPAAFIAGTLGAGREYFALLLGLSLLLSAWRLWPRTNSKYDLHIPSTRRLWYVGVPAGAALGALAGIIGIGGGVFLSPMLIFLRWTDVRQTAAVASAFILLNSISGLIGHLGRGATISGDVLFLALIVVAGGWVGANSGAVRLRPMTIRIILSAVLVIAGGKLLGTTL